MDPTRWLLRASRWARNPPSEKRVLLLALIAVCLAIWGLEKLFGFPAWLEPESLRF